MRILRENIQLPLDSAYINIVNNLDNFFMQGHVVTLSQIPLRSERAVQLNIFFFENDFKAIFPELYLIGASIAFLLFGSLLTTSKSSKYPMLLGSLNWLGVIAILWTLILLTHNPITDGMFFYNTLVLDRWGLFLKCLLIFGALFVILISLDYMKEESVNHFEYLILLLLSSGSMLFLISSYDFISMYLAIELQSLCFYVMAAAKRDSEFSTEAGLKYFLLGAFSSGLLLWGCSMIYGLTGLTNFSELGKFFTCGSEDLLTSPFLTFGQAISPAGLIFILVGFLFKLTAFPFHMWAPDVYEGAPSSVTAFFSIAPKISILAIFVRICVESFYDFFFPWQTVLIFSSIGSMIFGAIAAMAQNKLKRLLAFSSIGHVGYMLIGLCCGTVEGLQALLVYLVIYVVMTINLFAVVLSPLRRDLTYKVQRIKYTSDLALLGHTNPLLAGTITIMLFSIAGIPPLAGFFSKACLFFAAISSKMYLLAVVGVLTSVISCFYYIRIIKIMYFELPKKWCIFPRISKENSIVLGLSLFFILFFLFFPSPLFMTCHKIVFSLSL